jgi:hypothetical protein
MGLLSIERPVRGDICHGHHQDGAPTVRSPDRRLDTRLSTSGNSSIDTKSPTISLSRPSMRTSLIDGDYSANDAEPGHGTPTTVSTAARMRLTNTGSRDDGEHLSQSGAQRIGRHEKPQVQQGGTMRPDAHQNVGGPKRVSCLPPAGPVGWVPRRGHGALQWPECSARRSSPASGD